MKVNISGRGVIPGIGTIPPIYGRDMSEKEVRRLLNFDSFRLYESNTGLLITRKNVSDIFSGSSSYLRKKVVFDNVLSSTPEETSEDVALENISETTSVEMVTKEQEACGDKEEVNQENEENIKENTDHNGNYNRNKNRYKKHNNKKD